MHAKAEAAVAAERKGQQERMQLADLLAGLAGERQLEFRLQLPQPPPEWSLQSPCEMRLRGGQQEPPVALRQGRLLLFDLRVQLRGDCRFCGKPLPLDLHLREQRRFLALDEAEAEQLTGADADFWFVEGGGLSLPQLALEEVCLGAPLLPEHPGCAKENAEELHQARGRAGTWRPFANLREQLDQAKRGGGGG